MVITGATEDAAERVIAGEGQACIAGRGTSFLLRGRGILVAMDRGLRASAVESRPVCYADIRLGVVVDVLLDDRLQRVLGFDVLCGDRAHRYLPLAACEVGEARISVSSALVLMRQELDFYRERGRALTAVRGFPVRRGGRALGTVLDLVFTPEGELLEVVVEADGGEATVAAGPELLVGPDALRPAV